MDENEAVLAEVMSSCKRPLCKQQYHEDAQKCKCICTVRYEKLFNKSSGVTGSGA